MVLLMNGTRIDVEAACEVCLSCFTGELDRFKGVSKENFYRRALFVTAQIVLQRVNIINAKPENIYQTLIPSIFVTKIAFGAIFHIVNLFL